ncbi:MAG: hypothetical protein H0W73_08625 [Bacteroidetes bacterium]|nr:hypothetical protein [Bacteroidota bacterium]
MILKLTFFFTFFYCSIFAQDTLVLCQKNDPSKEYKIELGRYYIKILSKQNEEFKAFLVGYKDSTFILKNKNYDKNIRKQVKALYEEALITADSLKLKTKQVDSLMLLVRKKETGLTYSIDTSIALSQIKKIKIENRFRSEKQKQIKNLERNGYIALIGTPVVLTLATLFLPPTSLPYIALPLFSIGITWVIVDLSLESKRLNFKKKWTVKRLIKA